MQIFRHVSRTRQPGAFSILMLFESRFGMNPFSDFGTTQIHGYKNAVPIDDFAEDRILSPKVRKIWMISIAKKYASPMSDGHDLTRKVMILIRVGLSELSHAWRMRV